MRRFTLAVGLAIALSQGVAAEELTPAALRQEIHAALRTESTTNGAQRDAAIRRLAELYDTAKTHEQLSDASRRQLTAQLRARLKRVEAALTKQLDQWNNAPQDASSDSPTPQAILAQVPGNLPAAGAPAGGPAQNNLNNNPGSPAQNFAGAGGNAFAAQTVANANELVELIQNTIAPKSWDIRGGPGTIRFFAPAQVLVIRQTDGIHDQVGAAIGRLRAGVQQP